jgi:hypothetical protein
MPGTRMPKLQDLESEFISKGRQRFSNHDEAFRMPSQRNCTDHDHSIISLLEYTMGVFSPKKNHMFKLSRLGRSHRAHFANNQLFRNEFGHICTPSCLLSPRESTERQSFLSRSALGIGIPHQDDLCSLFGQATSCCATHAIAGHCKRK